MSTQTNTTSNGLVWFDIMNAVDVAQHCFDSSGSAIPCRTPEPTALQFYQRPSNACLEMPPNL